MSMQVTRLPGTRLPVTRRRALGGAVAAGALLASGRRARADDTIRIGVLNDPNGVYADNGGLGSVIATRMALEEVGGTLLGRDVEVITGDNQNRPDLATSIARQWMDERNVALIVDGASSAAGLAIQQVAREKDRVFVASGPATSDFTGKDCSPVGFQFSYDTWSLAHGTGAEVTRRGGKSWFFITVDYAFGQALERDTTRFVQAAGGRVLGSVRHPIGTTDFSSYLLQAQSSGAEVVAFANAGADTQNALKQAAEFGIGRSGGPQRIAALLIFVTDVLAVGLPVAQNLLLTTPFYWDRTDETRAWSKRFMALKPKPPSMLHAGCYSGVRHWLAAAKAAGSIDGQAVAAKMRAMPVNDMNNRNVTLRGDGRLLCDMYLMQVKTPSAAKGPFDLYHPVSTIPGAQAFRPLAEGGCPLAGG